MSKTRPFGYEKISEAAAREIGQGLVKLVDAMHPSYDRDGFLAALIRQLEAKRFQLRKRKEQGQWKE